MPYIYSGKQLRVGKAWKDNDGVMHPANWATAWSDADKAAKGVVWQDPSPQDAPFDSRFYWGRQADGTLIPRSLDDVAEVDENGDPVLDEKGQQVITKGLRTQLIEKVKTQAGAMLAETDWMVAREAETGIRMPSQTKAYRQAVRKKASEMEAAITAINDLASFIALNETSGDVDNPMPAPLSDWPKEDDNFDYVPDQVSMRQARLALEAAGLLTAVDSSITGTGRIEWDASANVNRHAGIVAALGVALNMTAEQIDALFKEAEKL